MMRHGTDVWKAWPWLVVLAGAVLAAAGCSHNHLAEYDFRHKTLGVATIAPPYPEVLSKMHLEVDAQHPVLSLLKAGAEVAREVSMRDFEARLDSAARNVDVSTRMGERVLRNGARQLRADPVADSLNPDYELEIRVRNYGITASSWTSAAYFMIDAELRLLDGATGRSLWKARVRATEPVRSTSVDVGRSVGNVITAVSLARMSTEEIQRELETLADFAADHLVGRLADALD